jgi:hypothetical protein
MCADRSPTPGGTTASGRCGLLLRLASPISSPIGLGDGPRLSHCLLRRSLTLLRFQRHKVCNVLS